MQLMKGTFLPAVHSLRWLIVRIATAMSQQHSSIPEEVCVERMTLPPNPNPVCEALSSGLLTPQRLHQGIQLISHLLSDESPFYWSKTAPECTAHRKYES